MWYTDDTSRLDLPRAAVDLAVRLGVNPEEKPSSVRLTQSGRMKPALDSGTWLQFTASQTISTRTCEFDWQAKAGPLGLISGRDALNGGEGRFDIMAFGIIPIARAKHTAALVRGELMRYLAEIPWAPDAILHNPHLRWHTVDADTLSVKAGASDTECEVLLTLDGEGRIAGAFAADRPRSAIPPLLPTPWRGRFSYYRRLKNRWLPATGEVAWVIDGTEITYWKGCLETWATV